MSETTITLNQLEPAKIEIVNASISNAVAQQEIIFDASCEAKYTLNILGYQAKLVEYSIGVHFPVKLIVNYPTPMVEGETYTVEAILQPIDKSGFNEFTCYLTVLGHSIFDESQSFITPLGSENAWTPVKIQTPIFFELNLLLARLEAGLSVSPSFFSTNVEGLLNVSNDAVPIKKILTWSAPGEPVKFNITAADFSSYNYTSLAFSQLKFYLNNFNINFNLELGIDPIIGRSVHFTYKVFSLDLSRLTKNVYLSPKHIPTQINIPTISSSINKTTPEFSLISDATIINRNQQLRLNGTLAQPKSGTAILSWAVDEELPHYESASVSNGQLFYSMLLNQSGKYQFVLYWLGDATTLPVRSNNIDVVVVSGTTGAIYINPSSKLSPISPINQRIIAGSAINLYIGNVNWAGSTFYLLLSSDNLPQLSSNDFRYTATMIAFAQMPATTMITPVMTFRNDSFPGTWTVNKDWVNGTLPKNIAGGTYFIKALCGDPSSLAVTDTSITVLGNLSMTPSYGAGGTPIKITGSAFSPNAAISLLYRLPNASTEIPLTTVLANNLGQFDYYTVAPDLNKVGPSGYNYFGSWSAITFIAKDATSGDFYAKIFYENERGLIQVGSQRAPGIIGNATNITSTMKVGQLITVAGMYFCPNVVTLYWDNLTINSVAVNASGSFSTNIVVPTSNVGWHTLTIKDKSTTFCVYIKITE